MSFDWLTTVLKPLGGLPVASILREQVALLRERIAFLESQLAVAEADIGRLVLQNSGHEKKARELEQVVGEYQRREEDGQRQRDESNRQAQEYQRTIAKQATELETLRRAAALARQWTVRPKGPPTETFPRDC